MSDVAAWLFWLAVLGAAALPLSHWLLRGLPLAPVGLSIQLGLLFTGYLVWLASSVGALANTSGSWAVALIGLALVGWSYYGRQTLSALRQRPQATVWPLIVFLSVFLLFAFIRAHSPEISGTEKPMDFAFLNAAVRDAGVPPQDPWLSGFGISYYYFGYFLMAGLVQLSEVSSAVGFNLALASLAGLAASAVFVLVVSLAQLASGETGARRIAWRYGLVAVVMLLLMGNLEGMLELVRLNLRLGEGFWQWLAIKDLTYIVEPQVAYPADPPYFWWWWRASRVIGASDAVTGATLDYTINEFPAFSLLLGDLHPHVMALPFLLTALCLALRLCVTGSQLVAGVWRARLPQLAATGVVFGALGFINSWDLPTALVVLVLALLVSEPLAMYGWRERLLMAGSTGLALFGLAILLYLPFYLGFRSQVSGIGLVALRSSLSQFLVVWLPMILLVAAVPWLIGRALPLDQGGRLAVRVSALLALALLVLTTLAGLAAAAGASADGLAPLLASGGIGTPLLLLALMLMVALPYRWLSVHRGTGELDAGSRFVLTLAGCGLGLLLLCEFVFVRDSFGNRMNTVFKLYYQSWAVFAVVSTFGLYLLGQRQVGRVGLRRGWRVGWRAAASFVVAMALVYPLFAFPSRMGPLGQGLTLDGLAWLRSSSLADYEAIRWLSVQPGQPVVLEATGDGYSEYGRVSAMTGLPTLLGWAGHEHQWRGVTLEPAKRKQAIDRAYSDAGVEAVSEVIRKYDVRFIYVGPRERQTYGDSLVGAERSFVQLGREAFSNEGVTIYQVDAR